MSAEPKRPCLVIGASGDIGQGIALQLLQDGRAVALTHSPAGKPAPRLSSDEFPGQKLRWYCHEARSSSGATQLVASVVNDFGAAPDLVYCSGVARDRALSSMTDEDWDEVLAVNLTGAFYAARAVARELVFGGGRIIFIGSVTATKGNRGQVNYAAAKGGLESMCRALAVELGRCDVTVNVVSPGLIEGRMVEAIPVRAMAQIMKASPQRRLGKPSDVAGMVSLLLSEHGGYVSGQTIQVDGGLTAA